ncbi:hypothetical protein D9757_006991 [Collybiopsis confluens]|uniref:BZIP domain-containing protein n=1 Tax=Collybiopsis confluens TaxID=2823264 RepID=A0A8H5HIR0_9AGAR|nr:hypothetical protein D9757_006991 [Collybiopsis confluens]
MNLLDLDNPQGDLAIPSSLNPSLDAELQRWQTLNFYNDMSKGPSNNPSSSRGSSDPSDQRNTRSRSHSNNRQGPSTSTHPGPDVQDAVLLAQFAAGAGSRQHPSYDPSYEALLALLQAQAQAQNISQSQAGVNIDPHLYGLNIPQLNFNPLSPHLSWPQPHQHPQYPYNTMPGMVQSPGYHNLPPINTVLPSGPSNSSSTSAASSSSAQPATAASPASASPGSPDSGDLNISEDKRRRNTAASARFRIKKKIRNLNLERTVSDLNGRADELEKEAADLRRENGWLKEIVMLKGSRLAGLDVSPQSLPRPPDGDASFWMPGGATSSQPTASVSRKPEEHVGQAEDSDSEDDSDTSSSKGLKTLKGKERQK